MAESEYLSEASESSGSEDMVEMELQRRTQKKQQRIALLKERGKAYIPPVVEESASRRSAGYKIMKNKGLIRKRKKESRNSRVNYRSKFEKAVMRRKGQVQDTIREGTSSGVGYSGEAGGIRTHVKKSTRLS
jgi:capsule polysaccharide export protein KpsC/LpsZ